MAIPEHRKWMYNRLLPNRGGLRREFVEGVRSFVNQAIMQPQFEQNGGTLRCPCKKHKNKQFLIPQKVMVDLYKHGFMLRYWHWDSHGEGPLNSNDATPTRMNEEGTSSQTLDDDHHTNPCESMIFDAAGPEFLSQFQQHMEQPPNVEAKKFYDLLHSAQRPLWEGCVTHSELSMAVKMLSIKVEGDMSQRSFDEILQTMKQGMPKDNLVVPNFYRAKKLVSALEQEGLMEIQPYGNEFNPSSAVRFMTAAIKSKFEWFCPTWGHATKKIRDLWFDEFKKCCRWDPKYDARIRQIFDIKGDFRFRGMMYQERHNYAKDPEYKSKFIPAPIWNQLIHYWASDKKFKNLSVANIANRASSEGSSMHTGGSISMGEHARRMEETTGTKPTMEEVFAKCHMKKDNSWVDGRAEKAFGEFKKRKAALLEISLSQDEDGEGLSCESQHMPDDLTIWKDFVPKGKKGNLYGLGSIGSTLSSKYSRSSFSIASEDENLEQELVKWQKKVQEQEVINQEQKQKLEQQQKRIESNECMLVALFGKLNMPLPPNFAGATPTQEEPNETDNISHGDNNVD